MQKGTCRILLLSGGADSMLLYQKNKFDHCVFFDYGQPHLKKEKKVISKINVIEIILPKIKKESNGFYQGRNLTFVFSLYENGLIKTDTELYIGTNADDKYPDNSKEFFDNLAWCLNQSFKNKLKIKLPLLKKTKKQILEQLKLDHYSD